MSILDKLKSALPKGWFGDSSPNSDAVLQGAAAGLSDVNALVQQVTPLTRIATTTGGFLDMVAFDFFGTELPRLEDELDASYLARIQVALFRKTTTKPAMSAAIGHYTGFSPVIVEHGAITAAGFTLLNGTDDAATYPDTVKPHHCFIMAFMQSDIPFAGVGGYGSTVFGYGAGAGRYIPSIAIDEGLKALILAVKPIGTKVWLKVVTAPLDVLESVYGVGSSYSYLDVNFVLDNSTV